MQLQTTTQFKKDLRRAKRRGKNLDKLWDIVERLQSKVLRLDELRFCM